MKSQHQRQRMMPRDGAGRMELIGGTGAVMHMIGMSEFMEIYKVDRTFQTQSPDSIDPDRTKADVPWAWKISDEVGCSNPIVARVFIQCAQALQNKKLKRGDAEKIKIALHTCKEDLRNCEKAFLRIAIEEEKIVKTVQTSGGIRIEKRVVNNLPQIPDLEHDATIFLMSAKRALQGVCQVINEFYGLTVQNARFDKAKSQLQAQNPQPKDLLNLLDQFIPIIERVLSLRNFQDHTPKKTIVENFRINADELFVPAWRVDPEQPAKLTPEMREIIGSLIELAEHVFFHALLDNVDPPNGPFRYVVEAADSSDGAAMRYRCELKFAQVATTPPSSGP